MPKVYLKIVVYILVPKEVVIDTSFDTSSLSPVLGVAPSVKARANICESI